MPVADGRKDGTEFIGPLSALPGVQKIKHKTKKLRVCRKHVPPPISISIFFENLYINAVRAFVSLFSDYLQIIQKDLMSLSKTWVIQGYSSLSS